ncbi:serine protease SPPA, chloroplastic [Trifolium repens]|nr:serine protease SPPA, chloroplastic [Trifolium repens]
MEEVAQGRVWTGKDAISHGLVDAIGGLSRAIAIAKLKAKYIPQDKHVTVVELLIPGPTLSEILRRIGRSLVGEDQTLKELLQNLPLSSGVQARMSGTCFKVWMNIHLPTRFQH